MIDQIKRIAQKNKFFNDLIYLGFRLFGVCYSILFYLFRIFPVDQKKVVCSSNKGKRYGDNPKYIADALLEIRPDLHYVWLLNDPSNRELPKGIKPVKNSIIRQVYELATAKIWIDSNFKQYGFRKRKGQYYIQTWHGSYGLKKIGKDRDQNRFDRDNTVYNMERVDLTVSNSKRTTEIFRKAFGYDGEILEAGSPRNDILFTDSGECRQKVDEALGTSGKRLLLYAPTFRSDFSLDAFNIDFSRLTRVLNDRFGGEWVILVRLHPNNLRDAASFMTYSETVISASEYDNMQELLAACELLITDYSSCMFDFVTTGKTCFLYASDIQAYKQDRDTYFELEELPFPLAVNNDELEVRIREFDPEKYGMELRKLFERVGLCESGIASRKTAEYILSRMEEK